MPYPNSRIENPTWLKITTKDDEIEEINYKTEKHYHENILKSLKLDKDYYKKRYKSLNKKQVFLIITEIFFASASTKTSSNLSISNPSIGVVLSSTTALFTSIAI